ncbi:MAG: ABC transporter permease [Firmicutes bacterium]|nr:ABC transporter permease [Bacillota bacterium]
MVGYVLRRLLYMVITLWVIASLTFFLMHMIPGDPFTTSKILDPVILQNIKAKYGLDQPLPVQYLDYLSNLIHGDLGVSYKYQGRTVNEIIATTFGPSFTIGFEAIAFAVVVGLALGIVAAVQRDTVTDRVAMVIAVLGISVPNFVIAALLQYFIGFRWQWLPISGWGGIAYTVLPALALAASPMAQIARMMRASMIEVTGQEYIKTARAKGLSMPAVVWRHMIRNAILPVVTILGPMIAAVVTGVMVVEQIFNVPGMGQYFVTSVEDDDYTMIMGVTLFFAALLVFLLFLVDVAYSWIDPRIRVGRREA